MARLHCFNSYISFRCYIKNPTVVIKINMKICHCTEKVNEYINKERQNYRLKHISKEKTSNSTHNKQLNKSKYTMVI